MAVTSRQLTFQLSGGPPYGIRLQGGDSSPFVISKIRPASKAEAIGLQECDVIVAVNGITSRGLSHSALTALMDSINTTLNLLVLRGPSAFYEVDAVQQSLGSQLTALTEAQKSSLLLASNQPEIVSPSRDNGVSSWSDNNGGSNSVFRLQSVDGKQRQHRQNNTNNYTSQPIDVVTYPNKADNYYSREEQSFNEDGVLRNTVEETERKTSDGMRMTTVTRREYSTRTTNLNDGPHIAQDFFQSTPLSGGIQEWFGERTEDGTYQTKSLNRITGTHVMPLNQQSIVNTTWTQHRGAAEPHENVTTQRRFISEPQVGIYETPGVKQAQNIVLPDFQISIGAGPRTDTRIRHPIVTVTPAEEHDVSNTVTLVGPSSWQHTQHQQQVKEYQGQASDLTRDHLKHAINSTDAVQVSTNEYYEPIETQRNRSEPQQRTRSRDIPAVSYEYQSTPVEVTWHEPSVVKILRKPDETQGHLSQGQPSHVDNITVSVGDKSHFNVNKFEGDQCGTPHQQVFHQPYHVTPQYHDDVTSVQDLYKNVYKTDHFPSDHSTNFDQRSRPAPVTYGQPYQQKPVASYQTPQQVLPPSVSYPYQPSNSGTILYQAPPGGETRYQYPSGDEFMYQPSPSQPSNTEFYHQSPATAKTGNKLPLNPHFRQEQVSNPPAATTLNEQQDHQMFQQQDRMPYIVTPYVQAQEPMSYSMAIEQARHEGGTQPSVMSHRPITAHNTWSPQNAPDYDPRYHGITNDVTPPTGYMIPQQVAPPVAAAPPLPAPPPPPQPPPANPYKVYGIAGGSNDPDKRLLESKVNLANSVAHSVTSPANMNSRGQKMFLRRQQNAHKWTKSGPDPLPEPPSVSSYGSNTGRTPVARPPTQAIVPGAHVERWNTMVDSGPVRTGVSLLRRSESADHVTNISPSAAAAAGINRSVDADQWTSNVQHQVPTAAAVNATGPSQTLSYRPVKFQFQKPAGSPSQKQWNQAPPADGYRSGLPPGVDSSHNMSRVSNSGFTDM